MRRLSTSLIWLFVVVLIHPGNSFAVSRSWTGATSTDWNNANNWNPAGVPTAIEGMLRVVVYSPVPGQGIAAGHGAVLHIPATVRDGVTEPPALTLAEIILVNPQAQRVPVTLGETTVPVTKEDTALPSVFALHEALPNPFNPSATIAYEVPQLTHVRLTVYNLLGQEVIRLVDEQKAPGRYTVTWNGRNAQGLTVASSVYLYRMTSSAGFTESSRMTLLK